MNDSVVQDGVQQLVPHTGWYVLVRGVCCLRTTVLLYIGQAGHNPVIHGPNTVYCLRTTKSLPAYDIQQNKRA